MDANITATPRAIMQGISDGSGRDIAIIDEKLPGHIPLLFILAQRGPEDIQYVTEVVATQTYGVKTFAEGSEYFNHQTNLLKTFIGNDNPVMVQRIIPNGAKKAILRLSLELIPTKIPVYEFNASGDKVYITDEFGFSRPKVLSLINGTRLIWHGDVNPSKVYDDNSKQFSNATIINSFRQGSVRSVDNEQLSSIEGMTSTLYPIMDIEIRDFGLFGNKVGFTLNDITGEGMESLNILSEVEDFLYRLRVVELDENNNPVIKRTPGGETSVLVGLGDDLYDYSGKFNYSIKNAITDRYNLLKNIYIYKENLKTVTDKLVNGYTQGGENILGELYNSYNNTDYLLAMGKINIIHGTNTQGQVYRTFTVEDSYKFLGLDTSRDYIYGQEGNDGLIRKPTGEHDILGNLEIFDTAVKYYLNNWGVNNQLLFDLAKFPFTTLWDSGFSIETKKAFATPMSLRSDIWVVLATFIVADYVGPPIELIEPQRSWMTLVGFDTERNQEDIVPIEQSKLQMGVRTVTNGYTINGITAKDAGDFWVDIPLYATIKRADAEVIRTLAETQPNAIVIRNTNGIPVKTAAQVAALPTNPDGSIRYPFTIKRNNPKGSLVLQLDWDSDVNFDYFANTWSLVWNINIQEPDPLASPVTYGSIVEHNDVIYLTREHFIEVVTAFTDNSISVNLSNDPAAGWYWSKIKLSALIGEEYVSGLIAKMGEGLADAVLHVNHNGTSVSYLVSEVLTLGADGEGNLVIPLIVDRSTPVGSFLITADYDGMNKNRFYATPYTINYNLTPVNPPQTVSTINYRGVYNNPWADDDVIDPQHVRVTEHTPSNGANKLFRYTNVPDAGWYWDIIEVYAQISAADVAAAVAAYAAGYTGTVVTLTHNSNILYQLNGQTIGNLTRDVNNNAIVPIRLNRNIPNGRITFNMDWDSNHLDYLPGQLIIDYQIVAVNPEAAVSWVNYLGLVEATYVESEIVPPTWYSKLRHTTLHKGLATQTLNTNGTNVTHSVTNKLEAGWYWDSAEVALSLSPEALSIIGRVADLNRQGDILVLTTPWRTYRYSASDVMSMSRDNNGAAYWTIMIPKTVPVGRMVAVVDWDLQTSPEATTTTIHIDYALNIVTPARKASVVYWGGVDTSYANIRDANYLIPSSYSETIANITGGKRITIRNDASAGWYWDKVHTKLTFKEEDIHAMLNSVYNEFEFTGMRISIGGNITTLTYDDIRNLTVEENGNYSYPITLPRTPGTGTITVEVDWDGEHQTYTEDITTFEYVIMAVNPNPYPSTVTYRGVKPALYASEVVGESVYVVHHSYLDEEINTISGGYHTDIETAPEAGWYWNSVKTYLAVTSAAIDFVTDAHSRGHTGTVLTITNGDDVISLSSQEIIELTRDLDGSGLIPYYIPRNKPTGTLVANVDWDTSVYPEATSSTVNIEYVLIINEPAQVPSTMIYAGMNTTGEYAPNGQYLLPNKSTEIITTDNVNSYRTDIYAPASAGWYWNKVEVFARISAPDLEVIETAFGNGYVGTVLSAYLNGSLVHSLNATQILALPRDGNGNALVPFTLSSLVPEGEITAVIDWDVNDLNYTQSNWNLDYRLTIERPAAITPVFTLALANTGINAGRVPAQTFTMNNVGNIAKLNIQHVYPDAARYIDLKYTLDNSTIALLRDLVDINPEMVVLNNGIDNEEYTVYQLMTIINNAGGKLEYLIVADTEQPNMAVTTVIDLDANDNNYPPTNHPMGYNITTVPTIASTIGYEFVEASAVDSLLSAGEVDGLITITLSDYVSDVNKFTMLFTITKEQWSAFKRAREIGMANNTIVLTMTSTSTNTVYNVTAEQLESLVYTDDQNNAYFEYEFFAAGGNITLQPHWTKGYHGYTAGVATVLVTVIEDVFVEIECDNATPTALINSNTPLMTTMYDLQLDGVIHRNINYTTLVQLCNAAGVEVKLFL